MGVIEVAVPGEVVDDWDALGLEDGLISPHTGPLRTGSGGGLSAVPP